MTVSSAHPRTDEILSPEARQFLTELHEHFADRRDGLLVARRQKRERAAWERRLDYFEVPRAFRTATPLRLGLSEREWNWRDRRRAILLSFVKRL